MMPMIIYVSYFHKWFFLVLYVYILKVISRPNILEVNYPERKEERSLLNNHLK